MSVLLKNNNWLVSDWVMKLFFDDCQFIIKDGEEYKEIKIDIDRSIKLYTFLLNYATNEYLDKIQKLETLVRKIIEYNKGRILDPGWDKEAFKVYRLKLEELLKLIADDMENQK